MTFIRSHPFVVSGGLLILTLLLSVFLGSTPIPLGDFFTLLNPFSLGKAALSNNTFSTILFDLRLPRTVLIAITGAALASSGAAFQGLFRNPLADPYLIGSASGAGLGGVIAMSINWPYSLASYYPLPLCAFLGALITISIVYRIARVGDALPISNLLLAGVAMSALTTAITSFLMLRSAEELHRAISWMYGGAISSGWNPVLAMLPYALLGLGMLFVNAYALNVLQFGEEQAQQVGLPVKRAQGMIIVAASLTTASAVAFSGIIGFAGLIVPHLLRLIWGNDYRWLLPLSCLCGGAFLLVADTLARVLIPPQEIPVGIITALCGAPFFLWLLRRSKKQTPWQ